MKIVSLFGYLCMKLIWWYFPCSIAEVRDGRALGILPTCLYVGNGAISPPPHVKVRR